MEAGPPVGGLQTGVQPPSEAVEGVDSRSDFSRSTVACGTETARSVDAYHHPAPGARDDTSVAPGERRLLKSVNAAPLTCAHHLPGRESRKH